MLNNGHFLTFDQNAFHFCAYFPELLYAFPTLHFRNFSSMNLSRFASQEPRAIRTEIRIWARGYDGAMLEVFQRFCRRFLIRPSGGVKSPKWMISLCLWVKCVIQLQYLTSKQIKLYIHGMRGNVRPFRQTRRL